MTALANASKPVRRTWARSMGRVLVVLLLLAAAVGVGWWGVKLRREMYEATIPIRFYRNVENAYFWGRNARAQGIFNLYESVLKGERYRNYNELDYPPLRLSVATVWQWWSERAYPDARPEWRPDYEFSAPMLWTDTVSAMLASIFVFLLIRMWTIRMDDARRPIGKPPRAFRGVIPGFIGACLCFLNPAVIWDGYIWVQWDMWPVPFFLAAVWLACKNRWFAAGASLAIGACLKGQLIIAAPIMLLWPLFQGRFGSAMRLLAGMGLMFMAIVFPWMKPSVNAISWYLPAVLGLGIIAPVVLNRKPQRPWIMAVMVVALLVGMALAWPIRSHASLPIKLLPLAVVGAVALARFLPTRALPQVYAMGVAVLILLMIPLYGASTGWFHRGFAYGADSKKQMHFPASYNVPALMRSVTGWPNSSMFEVRPVGEDKPIRIRTALGVVYCAMLLLCGFAAARHYRNNDPRFLLAISLPWLIFFMLLTQMFSRYLMYGAAMAALLPAVGAGATLLGIVLSIIAVFGIAQSHFQLGVVNANNLALVHHPLLDWIPRPQTLQMFDPHIGWMLVLITLIFLYLALAPASWIRGRTRRHL